MADFDSPQTSFNDNYSYSKLNGTLPIGTPGNVYEAESQGNTRPLV